MSSRLVLAVVLGAALACDTGPTGGLLTVNLTTPNSGGDRAMLLTVTGPAALAGANAAGQLRLFAASPPFGTTNRFVLTGTLATGAILTIGVADVGKGAAYSATIQQVAAPNYQLRTLTGYSLKISR